MHALFRSPPTLLTCIALLVSGCTQVGPDYTAPTNSWLEQWRSPALQQVSRQQSEPDFRQWWLAFDDPLLNRLIAEADAHNPSLQIAGLRVLEARAALGIAQSTLYPQLQQGTAESLYLDRRQSGGDNPRDSSAWQYQAGFNLGWELDFWGRFSRAIESADASYLASQANYQDVLVLLRAQVAQTYFALRTAEARLRIAKENA
ncbi:MAG TPA: TolC family protein, partial [Pseudomonas sp.]|nr:TolC family protein [Pseudomonas sp.]